MALGCNYRLIYEYKSNILKVKNSHLTGVEKSLIGWNLTVESVKSWVETINCGPAP